MRVVENQSEREGGLIVFPDAHRMRKLRQPSRQAFNRRVDQWLEICGHLACLRIIPFAQFGTKLKQPDEPIWPLETGPAFPREISRFAFDILLRQAARQSTSRLLGEWRFRKRSRQAREQPVS